MNPVFSGELTERDSKRDVAHSNFLDILPCELCQSVRLSVMRRVDSSALGIHVGDICGMRPKEKVGRIYAKRIIAVVANLYAFGNLTVVHQPTCPIEQDETTAPPAPAKPWIALAVEVCAGNPARFCFGYGAPKAFTERIGKALRESGVLAKLFWHKSVSLICVALRAGDTAPGHFHSAQ